MTEKVPASFDKPLLKTINMPELANLKHSEEKAIEDERKRLKRQCLIKEKPL